jgi:hypothetical protein
MTLRGNRLIITKNQTQKDRSPEGGLGEACPPWSQCWQPLSTPATCWAHLGNLETLDHLHQNPWRWGNIGCPFAKVTGLR